MAQLMATNSDAGSLLRSELRLGPRKAGEKDRCLAPRSGRYSVLPLVDCWEKMKEFLTRMESMQADC